MISEVDVFTASEIANYASGISVEYPGTVTPSLEEIKKRILESDVL